MTPQLQATLEAAARALQQGRMAEAERMVRGALESNPGQPDLLHLLGLIALNAGRVQDACQLLVRAATGSPRRWQYWYNLGLACYRGNFHEDARVAFERALALDPEQPAAVRNMLGSALLGLGAAREATRVFREAVDSDPGEPGIRLNLATALSDAGDQDQALAVLEDTERSHPDLPGLWSLRGLALYRAGRFDAALDAYDRALESEPERGELYYRIALARRCTGPDDPRYQAARRALEQAGDSDPDRITLHFALAKMEDELGNAGAAFTHADEGNALKAARVSHEPEALARETDAMIEACRGDWFDAGGSDDRRPLLIVGMPRSGTTLLEQLLCRHPDIATAGELTWLQRLSFRLGGPERPPDPEEAAGYLEALVAEAPGASRIIDKNPTNFRLLGLAARLFPKATIIHLRRRPLETLRSIYFANLARGQAWSSRLDWLGHYYVEYRRLMAHWREVLPTPLLEVDYEALVADPRSVLESLIDDIGLAWSDELLDEAAGSSSSITTASAWQARQPVHDASVRRGQAYAEYLEPAMSIIRDAER